MTSNPSLLVNGHLSRIVALAIECGMPPLEAISSREHSPGALSWITRSGRDCPRFSG